MSDERLEINEDVFLLLTTDDTDYTVFKAIAHFFTRWPLAASHDGRRMKTDERRAAPYISVHLSLIKRRFD